MANPQEPALPKGSKIVKDGPSTLEPAGPGHGGGTGAASAGSKASRWPEGGAPSGSEGGADPPGPRPVKGDIAEEGLVRGPQAGDAM